ncbi:MAG TPA: RMD1 family protein [Stellaceae bacterium]|nr:RMD1 family protein [Stellaceae bacterium]
MDKPSEPASGAKPTLGIEPPVVARALLLGERLETRGLEHQETLGRAPLVARVNEGGIAVLFRYGAIVLFNVTSAAEKALIGRLRPLVTDALETIESEELRVGVQKDAEEQIDLAGVLSLRELSVERLQIVADVLAKSLMLAYYETRVAGAFDRIEPLAQMLGQSGRAGSEGKVLLRQIGSVLGVQHKMVGRVGTGEKPDLLWDHPELERLYARLSEEYELRERDRALDRKLEVISRTVETLLGLVQQRSSIRVEWYIVLLIVVEIVISVFSSLAR